MSDWNVVATVREPHFALARKLLEPLGTGRETDYFNVLALTVSDPRRFLEEFRSRWLREEELRAALSRIVPVADSFTFQDAEDFQERMKRLLLEWIDLLSDRTFHVRMHRRGFKGRISAMQEEQALDAFLMEELRRSGHPGRITFEDPDAIVAVETIGNRGGISLWTRSQREQYPFLNLD